MLNLLQKNPYNKYWLLGVFGTIICLVISDGYGFFGMKNINGS